MFKENRQSSKYLLIIKALSDIIKQIFEIKKRPFPWSKSIKAGICSGFPVMVGLLMGRLDLGLLAGMGSFSYLYVFNEPYAARAKKIFFVIIGISASVALGTLSAPYPILVVLIVGIIGAVAIFIFGVLRIPGPSALFFVLSFIMTTGMTIDPSAVIIRTLVVFMSGCFAWIISMAGYFFKPHGPEIKALQNAYLTLLEFSKAIGTENINDVRYRTVNALKESEEILLTGYISWKNSYLFNRLSLLNEQANKFFLEMLQLSFNRNAILPKEFTESIRILSIGIESKNGQTVKIAILPKALDKEYHNLLEIVYDAEAIMNIPLTNIGHGIKVLKPSVRMKFTKACDKDSIVFINSVRYGIVLSISAVIAFHFSFARPYWIPLSCASVMLGSTIISTFHRAVQRSCGTIIGLMVAIAILNLQPKGFMVAIIIMCLTALAELFIVKNYGLVAIFITPNALLLAETSTKIHDISYFATAHITDIVIGAIIGLIGTYIIGQRSASSRLPGLMTKLIRNQSQVLVRLVANRIKNNISDTKWIKEKLQINLINFKIAYSTALGEIGNNRQLLEMMWPAVFSIEHITYLLDQCCSAKGYLNLSDEELSQLLLVLEKMAGTIEQKQVVYHKNIRIIDKVPKLCSEINNLQEALSINKYILKDLCL